MIKLLSCKGKKIGVYGLARTGIATCEALNQLAEIIAYDSNTKVRDEFLKLNLACKFLDIENPEWRECEFIVISPGIPLYYPKVHPIVELSKRYNIPLRSDIDLLYNERPDCKYIGITGTNGKSTTCALIHHILKFCGKNFDIGGNIGKAALSMANEAEGYILELSSFQLDTITSLKLDIAALLNITPDHLDRYNSVESYTLSKEKILLLLKDQGKAFVFSEYFLANRAKSAFLFSITPGVARKDNLLPKNNISLLVEENVDAAYLVCCALGCNENKIKSAISEFRSLKHRIQYIGKCGNINFYNDSKATNAKAAEKSLSVLSNIYWLAGGISKGDNLDVLIPALKNVKKAYFYGESRYNLAKELKAFIHFSVYNSIEEAFNAALSDVEQEVNRSEELNILLAPACSSYDQFSNYEERGDKFINLSSNFISESENGNR